MWDVCYEPMTIRIWQLDMTTSMITRTDKIHLLLPIFMYISVITLLIRKIQKTIFFSVSRKFFKYFICPSIYIKQLYPWSDIVVFNVNIIIDI